MAEYEKRRKLILLQLLRLEHDFLPIDLRNCPPEKIIDTQLEKEKGQDTRFQNYTEERQMMILTGKLNELEDNINTIRNIINMQQKEIQSRVYVVNDNCCHKITAVFNTFDDAFSFVTTNPSLRDNHKISMHFIPVNKKDISKDEMTTEIAKYEFDNEGNITQPTKKTKK